VLQKYQEHKNLYDKKKNNRSAITSRPSSLFLLQMELEQLKYNSVVTVCLISLKDVARVLLTASFIW
jgi:hypothetical protein